jgi:hypothetical protein
MNRRLVFVLGTSFFAHLPVTIDYPGHTLTLHDPKRDTVPAGSKSLPLRIAERGGVAFIEARLLDLPAASFLLDTGSGACVFLNAPYVAEHQLLEQFPRHAEVPIVGIEGASPGRTALATSFTLAEHVFHDVPVSMALESKGRHETQACVGSVGAGLFSRFAMTVDFPHKRVVFQPGDSLDAPFEEDRLGLRVRMKEGRAVAEFVIAGSPAARAGLVPGDEILKVDGVEFARDLLFTRLRQVRREPAGTVVRLGLNDGKELVITLANYL